MRPFGLFAVLLACLLSLASGSRAADGPSSERWELARRHRDDHRFSTLFTAHDVRRHLATDAGLATAVAWCRDTAVTKVYVETFRDGYQAEREALAKARDRFRSEGFEVSGCVTPTNLGKKSNRWNIIACYTDQPTQDRLESVFEFTAGLFDEVMIDDFWFTDCSCGDCDRERLARRVTVGERATVVPGDTWEEYRRELMLRLSAERVIEPSRKVNPRCRLIIKYPQWYDVFHERGYDVVGETRLFDRTWVGTETRDYGDAQWGGTVQYEAYFIMRWLGGLGGEKCGGGWYDWLGTTEATYVEQARQTILAGARESLLFCYGGLQGSTGPKNVAALRTQLPELFRTAAEVRRRTAVGIAAYKPPHSPAGAEKRVFDFVGMLGLPLVPTHEFPTNAPAAFFSVHALADGGFAAKFGAYVDGGRPVLITDGLAAALPENAWKGRRNVHVLAVKGNPKAMLGWTPEALAEVRGPMLAPWGLALRGPNRVALCLFSDGSQVLQNFNDTDVEVAVGERRETIPARGWVQRWTGDRGG
jgi:hypothetical protein